MKNVFAQTFPSGSVRVSTTSITLANNTAKTQDITVPTDSEWVIELIKANNPDDVARAITMTLYQTSAKTVKLGIINYASSVNANANSHFPNNDDLATSNSNQIQNLLIGAGMTIEVVWAAGGASSGGVAADGLTILYRHLSKP